MKFKLLLHVLLLFFLTSLFSATWRPGEMKVRLDNVTPESVQEIAELGIEIDHIQFPEIFLYVIPQEFSELKNAGFKPEIIIPDMAAYSRSMLKSPALIGYYDYYSALQLVDSLLVQYPDIFQKFVYGKSVHHRELYAVKISDNVHVDENEPEVAFDGCHHGDEIMSAEILVRLMEDLCSNYGRDDRITRLIDQREIWIFPFANPDGRQALTRRNANYVDLNRDWGYMWDAWGNSETPYSQPETRAVFHWMQENQFVISQSLHAGTEMISYPWSYRPTMSPDNRIIDHFASGYAEESKYSGLKFGNGFKRLYPINGSAKDSYYGIYGSMGWTVEVSENKAPPSSEIGTYYKRNRPAMLYLIEMANRGIRGRITDALTGKPVKATIWVRDQQTEYWPVYNDPATADFHRLLLPGIYNVRFTANGYEPTGVANISVSDTGAAVIDIKMQPAQGTFAHQVTACRIPGNNFSDDGLTYRALSIPDRRYYSLGKNGWIVLDLGTAILDLPGNDLRIYEGDASAEGFVVKVSNNLFGDWRTLGSGRGTTEFDLASKNIKEIRYIRIEDDGDGYTGTSNAGFDLDAVEANPIPSSGSYLLATKSWVTDTLSNFNGVLEIGEQVGLKLEIDNPGSDPISNVLVRISTEDPDIAILQDSTSIQKILPRETVILDGFELQSIAEKIQNQEILLDVELSAANGNRWQHPFKIKVRAGADISIKQGQLEFENQFIHYEDAIALELTNQGLDTLKVFQLKTDGTAFSVENSQLIVPPKSTETVNVLFLPSEAGHFSDTLTVLTNDPRKPFYRLPMSGVGVFAPHFSVARDSLSFILQPTDSIDFQLPVENTGAGDLVFSVNVADMGKETQKEKRSFWYSNLREADEEPVLAHWEGLPANNIRKLTLPPSEMRSAVIPLSFNFPFYDSEYASLRINKKGWLVLENEPDDEVFSKQWKPDSLVAVIAPLLALQETGAKSEVLYYSDGASFIVHWRQFYTSDKKGPFSFGVELFENGDIRFQFLGENDHFSQLAAGIQTAYQSDIFRYSEPEYEEDGTAFWLHRKGWMQVLPNAGVVAENGSESVHLQVASRDALKGDYWVNLIIESNDPASPQIDIPIRISVSGEALIAGDAEAIPNALALLQNYPNPFNPQTTIAFNLPERAFTRLIIYNALGQAVRTLVEDHLPPGEYQISWEATNDFGQQLPSGIYFYELKADEISRIKKMVLLH